jgi:hypothetical protein
MKRVFLIVVLLSLAAVAVFLLYHAFIPTSDKLFAQYQEYIVSIDQPRYAASAAYRWEVDQELLSRQHALARAYNADRKPDSAIMFLEGLIETRNEQQYIFGRKLPRNAGQAALVAIYYELLANSYDMKHDEKKKTWALKKSKEYKEEALRLEKK